MEGGLYQREQGQGQCQGQCQGSRKGHDIRKGDRKGKGGCNGGKGTDGEPKVPKAQIMMNAQVCKAADSGGANAVLDFVAQRHTSMSLVNLTTALHKLARCCKDVQSFDVSDPRCVLLRVQTRLKLQKHAVPSAEPLPRCWATIAWAYATMLCRDEESLQSLELIGQIAVPHVKEFKPVELTNLLWAFAKLSVKNSALFHEAMYHILASSNHFSQSNLSTIVWAYVTAQHTPCQQLLRSVGESFVKGLVTAQYVNPTEITNFVWGVATAQLRLPSQLIAIVGDIASKELPQFKLHELSITAWSLSRLSTRHDAFFFAAAKALQTDRKLRHQIHPQGIANLLWAFAKQVELSSDVADELRATLPMLIPTCSRLLNQLKPLELSSVLWALSRLGARSGLDPGTDELFYAATALDQQFLRQLSLQSCVNLLGAYSAFIQGQEDITPGACIEILRVLASACLDQSAKMSPVSETAILEALVSIKHPAPEVMSLGASAVAAAARDIRRFNRQGLERLASVAHYLDERQQRLLMPVITGRMCELKGTGAGVMESSRPDAVQRPMRQSAANMHAETNDYEEGRMHYEDVAYDDADGVEGLPNNGFDAENRNTGSGQGGSWQQPPQDMWNMKNGPGGGMSAPGCGMGDPLDGRRSQTQNEMRPMAFKSGAGGYNDPDPWDQPDMNWQKGSGKCQYPGQRSMGGSNRNAENADMQPPFGSRSQNQPQHQYPNHMQQQRQQQQPMHSQQHQQHSQQQQQFPPQYQHRQQDQQQFNQQRQQQAQQHQAPPQHRQGQQQMQHQSTQQQPPWSSSWRQQPTPMQQSSQQQHHSSYQQSQHLNAQRNSEPMQGQRPSPSDQWGYDDLLPAQPSGPLTRAMQQNLHRDMRYQQAQFQQQEPRREQEPWKQEPWKQNHFAAQSQHARDDPFHDDVYGPRQGQYAPRTFHDDIYGARSCHGDSSGPRSGHGDNYAREEMFQQQMLQQTQKHNQMPGAWQVQGHAAKMQNPETATSVQFEDGFETAATTDAQGAASNDTTSGAGRFVVKNTFIDADEPNEDRARLSASRFYSMPLQRSAPNEGMNESAMAFATGRTVEAIDEASSASEDEDDGQQAPVNAVSAPQPDPVPSDENSDRMLKQMLSKLVTKENEDQTGMPEPPPPPGLEPVCTLQLPPGAASGRKLNAGMFASAQPRRTCDVESERGIQRHEGSPSGTQLTELLAAYFASSPEGRETGMSALNLADAGHVPMANTATSTNSRDDSQLKVGRSRLSAGVFRSAQPRRTCEEEGTNGPAYVTSSILGMPQETSKASRAIGDKLDILPEKEAGELDDEDTSPFETGNRFQAESISEMSPTWKPPDKPSQSYVVKNTFVESPGEDDKTLAARLGVQSFRSVQPARTCDIRGNTNFTTATAPGAALGLFEDLFEGDS